MTQKEIYDEQIAPLMVQLDKIVTEHGMAYLAAVQYSPDDVVMSVALRKSSHKSLHAAHYILEQAILADAETATYTQL